MSFLHRQRSNQAFRDVEKETKRYSKPQPVAPSPAAVENVPQHTRTRTTSNLAAIKRIFSSRRKAPPNLKLVSSTNSPSRRSWSSSRDSFAESEDDIRCPSALGSAVTITSNRSLPPSPFAPPPIEDDSPFPLDIGEYKRTRAISSPNLLRSLSLRVRGKAKMRRGSIIASPNGEASPQPQRCPALPRKAPVLPEEIIASLLSYLPRPTVASCATTSRSFANAARTSLYATIDTAAISLIQLEKLVALLASRSDLAEFVTTFICQWWPSFFISDTRTLNGRAIQHKDALLTATFTLALERMSNLTSLTLPAFDVSLLAHHSAFGLKSLTFLHPTTTEAETEALFTWLDGQTNITSLRFPNLDDTPNDTAGPLSIRTNIPDNEHTRAGTAPSSPYLKPFPVLSTPTSSPRSSRFAVPPSPSSAMMPTPVSPFTSPTLLPHLTILHATPALVMLLAVPSEASLPGRPLKEVSLNINTTLYTGLRPASLMSCFRGVSRLVLRFTDNVDRRSFEKMLGAAGASLGSSGSGKGLQNADDPFIEKSVPDGLRILEISFPGVSTELSGRDEALYKSLQSSLPRYKALSSLLLSTEDSNELPQVQGRRKPSTSEKALIDSWTKTCPTLACITLLSGARWSR